MVYQIYTQEAFESIKPYFQLDHINLQNQPERASFEKICELLKRHQYVICNDNFTVKSNFKNTVSQQNLKLMDPSIDIPYSNLNDAALQLHRIASNLLIAGTEPDEASINKVQDLFKEVSAKEKERGARRLTLNTDPWKDEIAELSLYPRTLIKFSEIFLTQYANKLLQSNPFTCDLKEIFNTPPFEYHLSEETKTAFLLWQKVGFAPQYSMNKYLEKLKTGVASPYYPSYQGNVKEAIIQATDHAISILVIRPLNEITLQEIVTTYQQLKEHVENIQKAGKVYKEQERKKELLRRAHPSKTNPADNFQYEERKLLLAQINLKVNNQVTIPRENIEEISKETLEMVHQLTENPLLIASYTQDYIKFIQSRAELEPKQPNKSWLEWSWSNLTGNY